MILSRQDRPREAVDLFERARALTPADDYRRATASVNLADLYRTLGDLRTARSHAREALRLSDEVLDPTDPFRTAILRSQAFVAVAEGQHHECWRRRAGRGPVETVQSPSVRRIVAGRARHRSAVTPAEATVVADPDFRAGGNSHAWRGGAAGDVVTSVAYREWLAGLRLPRLQHARQEANVVRGFAPDARTFEADAAVEAFACWT